MSVKSMNLEISIFCRVENGLLMEPDRIGSLDCNKLEIFISDIFFKFGFQIEDCFVLQNPTAAVKLNLFSYHASKFNL